MTDETMIEYLSKVLKERKKTENPGVGFTPSAVLVPLYEKEGQYHLLYTLRSLQVRDHKGQISFPGGVQETSDSNLIQTALRESEEEIGLKPGSVEIIGELEDILTPTQYRITPFVGLIPHPYSFTLNAIEIAELVEVPLNFLLEPANLCYGRPDIEDCQWDTPFFRYERHTIWGATGRITKELVELIQQNTLLGQKKSG